MAKRKGNDGRKANNPDTVSAPKKLQKTATQKTASQQKVQNQRSLKSFFAVPTGKLFVVRPNIELEIEINLSEVGTKTKISHFIVLEVPTVTQEISTTSAIAETTTTAIKTMTTSTTSTSFVSIEPSTSGMSVSLTATAHVDINTDDDTVEGIICVYLAIMVTHRKLVAFTHFLSRFACDCDQKI